MLTDLQVSPLIGRFVGKFAVNRLLKIPPLLASGGRQPGCGKHGLCCCGAVLHGAQQLMRAVRCLQLNDADEHRLLNLKKSTFNGPIPI